MVTMNALQLKPSAVGIHRLLRLHITAANYYSALRYFVAPSKPCLSYSVNSCSRCGCDCACFIKFRKYYNEQTVTYDQFTYGYH